MKRSTFGPQPKLHFQVSPKLVALLTAVSLCGCGYQHYYTKDLAVMVMERPVKATHPFARRIEWVYASQPNTPKPAFYTSPGMSKIIEEERAAVFQPTTHQVSSLELLRAHREHMVQHGADTTRVDQDIARAQKVSPEEPPTVTKGGMLMIKRAFGGGGLVGLLTAGSVSNKMGHTVRNTATEMGIVGTSAPAGSVLYVLVRRKLNSVPNGYDNDYSLVLILQHPEVTTYVTRDIQHRVTRKPTSDTARNYTAAEPIWKAYENARFPEGSEMFPETAVQLRSAMAELVRAMQAVDAMSSSEG